MIDFNIKSIQVETTTENCYVDTEELHATLLQLPARKYIELYYYMKNKIENNV